MVTFPTLPTARLTSAFGWRTHPVTGQVTFHHGIDLAPAVAGTPGVPVYAAQDAVVKRKDFSTISGYFVILEHTGDSYYSQYLHLDGPAWPAVGEPVLSGQQIGVMGKTGRVTGIHLDFGVLTSYPPVYGSPGNFVDPQPYLTYAQDPDPNEPPYYPGTSPIKRTVIFRARNVKRRR